MKTQLATAVVAVLVAGGNASAQSADGGSQVPCQAPLAWRVARVDPEFALGVGEARVVVSQAAAMWESAVGRRLFVNDRENGFPIRLVYDQRQSRAQDRIGRQQELDRAYAELAATREVFLERAERHEAAATRYNQSVRDLERRVAEHNATVRRWNEQGGAPDEVATELERAGLALDAARRELEAQALDLEERQRDLQAQEASLAEDEAEHMRAVEAHQREFPQASEQAGAYREAVRMEGSRVTAVGREIRVYRFADEEDLRLVVAHELGHALGLGHGGAGDAVMSEEHVEGGGARSVSRVHAADVEQLRARCPGLAPTDPRGVR
jgi:hypothetical protein